LETEIEIELTEMTISGTSKSRQAKRLLKNVTQISNVEAARVLGERLFKRQISPHRAAEIMAAAGFTKHYTIGPNGSRMVYWSKET